jgi:uncharacterized protein YjbI with pentapeptide repeats
VLGPSDAAGAGETDYRGKSLPAHSFVDEMLDQANFEGAKLEKANFKNATLKEANFKDADLTRANFEKANLTGANLEGANLERTRFVNANLSKAHLAGAKLHLAGSTVYTQDLNKVKDNVPFSVSLNQIYDTNNGSLSLHEADLRNAKVEGNLEGVDFRRADLRGADFSEAERLEPIRFRKAIVDRATRWPTTFSPQDAGVEQGKDLGPSKPPLAGRWLTRGEEGGAAQLGLLDINPDNTYDWMVGESEASIHGNWRPATATDGAPEGGIVLSEGEQGLDWVAAPDGRKADPPESIVLRATTKKLQRSATRRAQKE